MKPRQLLARLSEGSSKNVRFDDFASLVSAFGFRLSRTRGSHNIFIHAQVDELVNIQNAGGEAKPYQIRQFLRLIERYNLTLEDEP